MNAKTTYEVKNRKDAEQVVAELLQRFSGTTVQERLTERSWSHKQALKETARRVSSNLFRSLKPTITK